MSKYSSGFKLEVAQYYLDGKGGFSATSKHFGVNHELLRGWVKKYQQHGPAGLIKQKRQDKDMKRECKIGCVK